MSRILDVIHNRNLSERNKRARRNDEINRLRNNVAFKANLNSYMKQVDTILKDKDVESVTVSVQDKLIARFQEAIFSDIMSSYDVIQNDKNPNLFNISYREI